MPSAGGSGVTVRLRSGPPGQVSAPAVAADAASSGNSAGLARIDAPPGLIVWEFLP